MPTTSEPITGELCWYNDEGKVYTAIIRECGPTWVSLYVMPPDDGPGCRDNFRVANCAWRGTNTIGLGEAGEIGSSWIAGINPGVCRYISRVYQWDQLECACGEGYSPNPDALPILPDEQYPDGFTIEVPCTH